MTSEDVGIVFARPAAATSRCWLFTPERKHLAYTALVDALTQTLSGAPALTIGGGLGRRRRVLTIATP